MSRTSLAHPDQEQLLRYADGELPSREVNSVRSHLEACWQCRVELEELQHTVAACIRYRKDVLQNLLPPTPSPWADIYPRFAEIDRSLDRPTLFQRAGRTLQWLAGYPLKWVPVPLALTAILVFVYYLEHTPSVLASELLRKAVVAANGQTKPRLIQIRTKTRSIRRLAGPPSLSTPADSLQPWFQAAHYDWNDPLSAKAYQAWRDQLPEKRDEVTEQKDGYRIRTQTNSGELTEATLRLSQPGLRPIEERFEFKNREWVEITDVSNETNPPTETLTGAPENAGKAPAGSAPLVPVSPAAPLSPAPTAGAGDELLVIAALHQIGADLGDPVDVARSGGQILVSGAGIPPQRQQEIRAALGSNPRVEIRFSEPAPAAGLPENVPPGAASTAEIAQLQARIAEKIGGRLYFDQLAAEVLDQSDQMMSRAYALRRLAEQFPVEAESQLNAQDRRLLRSVRQDHTSELMRLAAGVDRLMTPVFASLGADSRAATPNALPSNTWQPATEEVFQSARQVEKLLAVMFGAAQGESSGQVPSQLKSSLAQLRARVAIYARIGTEETRTDK